MTTRVLWTRVTLAYQQGRTWLRERGADADYARYLKRCTDAHHVPMDRGRYFAQRLEERYRTTSRCC